MRTLQVMTVIALLAGALVAPSVAAQQTASAANLTLPAATSPLATDILLDPEARAWQQLPVRRLALNRTPPLYDTEPPAGLEIPLLEVRVARVGGSLLVHLSWRDSTPDAATLVEVPATPPEQRNLKEPTVATERFFDAAAVMYPANPVPSLFTPSLQMGDPELPVTIYYWNAARGALVMDARGRSTTRRTDQVFPARGVYRAGLWRLTLALPDLPAGVPLAFAVWNGRQLDRDGRKYFSVWHWLE